MEITQHSSSRAFEEALSKENCEEKTVTYSQGGLRVI